MHLKPISRELKRELYTRLNHHQKHRSAHKCNVFLSLFVLCGSVAEWLWSQACNQRFADSNAVHRAVECNLWQDVYAHVPLSASSIVWYQPMGGDARQLGR